MEFLDIITRQWLVVCFLTIMVARVESVWKEQKPFKPPDPAMAKGYWKANNFGKWLKGQCPAYATLINKKRVMTNQIIRRVDKMAFNEEVPEDFRKAQIDTLMIFIKELNETDILLMDSFKWMEKVMKGDYNDFVSLKKSSEERLTSLRAATLKEEQEYLVLVKAEVSIDLTIFIRIHFNIPHGFTCSDV